MIIIQDYVKQLKEYVVYDRGDEIWPILTVSIYTV